MSTKSEALPKAYAPQEVETRWYETWEQAGYFRAEDESEKPPYCIVIPPPNVTGSLHMGHALTNTIQDILTRWRRMQGYNTLWLPGTDHAGIATQMVVERELAKEKLTRHDLGREAFLERVWAWKERYGNRITTQLKALGASLDWERERFTMDPRLTKAVREAFVKLYEDGLIYRAERLINWSPALHTVLSDLEVEHQETKGKLWSFAYPLAEGEGEVVIATTRPETMLGDTAVAVHPDDDRYKALIGKMLRLPIVNREIPIIADTHVDPAYGTGAVKVTPAHDPNDFEIGQRHDLPRISIFDGDAKLTEAAGAFVGEDRFSARKLVLAQLEEEGLMRGEKDIEHAVGRCQRSGDIVEPMLSQQWFVKADVLAKPAIEAVENGTTKIIPKTWEKTYFHWMYNIRDWCISRQLWWGHRIPAWYCGNCDGVTVTREDPVACAHCGHEEIRQDEDVLDTWFSSGLWPFSTLGWPEQTPALKTFYPNTVMETGFDILFFWVARMMMMGLRFMGEVPFDTVYLHAMVRDIEGKKMSKTRGNVIDPLDVSEEHGADALRFTLATLTNQGRDIKLSLERVVGYRNFINKLWNASRFALMNLEDYEARPFEPEKLVLQPADRWILSRFNKITREIGEHLEGFQFGSAADAGYRFTWNELCDWYIEMSKAALRGDRGEAEKLAAQATLTHVLEGTLRLLHPMIPFVTEEVWQKLPVTRDESRPPTIMLQDFPVAEAQWIDEEVETDVALLIDAVSGIRTVRGESNIPFSAALTAIVHASDEATRARLETHGDDIAALSNVERFEVSVGGERPARSAAIVNEAFELFIPLEGVVDLDAERARIAKAIKKVEADIAFVEKRLANKGFVERAPEALVAEQKDKLEELKAKGASLSAHAERLA